MFSICQSIWQGNSFKLHVNYTLQVILKPLISCLMFKTNWIMHFPWSSSLCVYLYFQMRSCQITVCQNKWYCLIPYCLQKIYWYTIQTRYTTQPYGSEHVHRFWQLANKSICPPGNVAYGSMQTSIVMTHAYYWILTSCLHKTQPCLETERWRY